MLVSCSGNGYSNTNQASNHPKFRAFVSNPLHQSQVGISPGLEIVDASRDLLSVSGVSLAGLLPDAGLMVVTPKKDRTLVVSQGGELDNHCI